MIADVLINSWRFLLIKYINDQYIQYQYIFHIE